MAMLDSAQDLVAVFPQPCVRVAASGRLALGKQREPRGAPPAPRRLDLPALAGVRALLEETSDRLIRPSFDRRSNIGIKRGVNDFASPGVRALLTASR